MRVRSLQAWLCGLALILAGSQLLAADDEEGFVSLFDGKTLEGWDGNPEFWSVKDGAITGQTTPEKPTKGNTFIIWKGGDVSDFELRLKFRIVGGNSGIQYRSKEVAKWVISGYQADFDGGGTWTGTLYEEKGRGVLAKRGSEVVIQKDGKKEEAGKTTPEAKILESMEKEGWNDYTIIADGNHLVQKVNGLVTIDVVDHQADKAAKSGLLALQLHAGPPMTVQFKDIRIKTLGEKKAAAKEGAKKVLLIAGRPSHGYGAHEHHAGCLLLAEALNENLPGVSAEVVQGWPEDKTKLETADSIVIYCDGAGGHLINPHLEEAAELMQQGKGLVCIHYAVEVTKGKPGDAFLSWLGGYFELFWSVNPHWTAEFNDLPKHPITSGVKPFAINDEWYYHMRFRPGLEGVQPILTSTPPENTRREQSSPRGGNPAVFARKGMPEHVAWAYERPEGGRGFGFTGGHVHWNWGNDQFRKLMLNAIVWTAGAEVPEGGVPSASLTVEDLQANQDEQAPGNFDAARIQQMLDSWNKTPAAE